LGAIGRLRKSGVILLSGDVHFAQFYSTKCKAMTGYELPELTTSGLTHHVNSFFKIADKVLPMVTPDFWTTSEMLVDFNFGLIQIQRTHDDDVEVKV
jgi:hypothetical protein